MRSERPVSKIGHLETLASGSPESASGTVTVQW